MKYELVVTAFDFVFGVIMINPFFSLSEKHVEQFRVAAVDISGRGEIADFG